MTQEIEKVCFQGDIYVVCLSNQISKTEVIEIGVTHW